MVFNATYNNISVISWRPVLLVEEAWITGEKHVLSQVIDKLYHIMLYFSPSSRFELTISMVICTDSIGSCESNYHTITTTMAPISLWCSKVVWCCKVSSVLWFRNRWYDFTFVIRSSKINVISIVWRNWIRLKLISSSYLPIDRYVFLRRP